MEALNLLPFKSVTVKTPTGIEYQGEQLVEPMCGVSIVRSGESMEEALRSVCRSVRLGKILIQRDEETAQPKLMYENLPNDISQRHVLLLDPMIASRGSACTAIEVLKHYGVSEDHITLVSLIAAPEGIMSLATKFPELQIVLAEVDQCLNSASYILPGLGDFGSFPSLSLFPPPLPIETSIH